MQSSQLAGVQTNDPRVQHAVAEAFVFGFRRIIWWAVALCVACALSAQFISDHPVPEAMQEGSEEQSSTKLPGEALAASPARH